MIFKHIYQFYTVIIIIGFQKLSISSKISGSAGGVEGPSVKLESSKFN